MLFAMVYLFILEWPNIDCLRVIVVSSYSTGMPSSFGGTFAIPVSAAVQSKPASHVGATS